MTRAVTGNRFALTLAGLFTALAAGAAPPHPLLSPGNMDTYAAQVRSISPQINTDTAVRAVTEALRQGAQPFERIFAFKPYGDGRPLAYFVVPDRTEDRFYTSGLLFCFEGLAGRVDSVFVLSPAGRVIPSALPTEQARDCRDLLETPAARLIPLVPFFRMS